MFNPDANPITPTSKYQIRWINNREPGSETVLNRPVSDLANYTEYLLNNLISSSVIKSAVTVVNQSSLAIASSTNGTLFGRSTTGTVSATGIENSNILTINTFNTVLSVGASITGTFIPANTTVIMLFEDGTNRVQISNLCISTSTEDISYSQNINSLYVDGIYLAENSRILLVNQIYPKNNGIYTVVNPGSVTKRWEIKRSSDANTWNNISSCLVVVDKGITGKDTVWICTSDKSNGTLGIDNITFKMIYSPSGETVDKISITDIGTVSGVKVVTTSTDNVQVVLGSIDTFRTIKLLIQGSNNLSFHTTEAIISHNNILCKISEYGTITIDNILASFDASIVNNNIILNISPTSSVETTFTIYSTSLFT